jgi:diacylglycerol kinase (ATP)
VQRDEAPLTLLSCSNSRYTGGEMMMAPSADVSDGRVDVVRIGPMSRRRLLACFPRLFAGTHPQMPEVTVRQEATVDFSGLGPRVVMLDGEIRTLDLHRLEVLPGALEMLA